MHGCARKKSLYKSDLYKIIKEKGNALQSTRRTDCRAFHYAVKYYFVSRLKPK